MLSNNSNVFLELVRAGLWEKDGRLSHIKEIGFNVVYRLAEEQSVVGLVLAGLEHSDVKPPQELLLQWIGEVQMIEQQNKAMNEFVAKLIEKLRAADVYAILVKGQGIAQCYKRPLWRLPGDVDLLLSKENYEKAKSFLLPLANSLETESIKAMHLGMTIDPWVVELHGTLRSCSLRKMDRVIDEVQNDLFYGGNVRSWQNGHTQVFLSSYDCDVFFVFTHIIKHFFREGIGLRQVCDWCRLLWIWKDSLNVDLLRYRIKRAGITTEWKAFAAYAVNYLGMPVDAMPLYSPEEKWLRKAENINDYILSVGNFGHNRENIYKESNYIVRKTKAFNRRCSDAINHLMIFPLDSIRVFFRTFHYGIVGFAKGI